MGALKLSTAQKAAIVLLSLGEEVSAEMFKVMQPSEIRTLTQTISRLGNLDQSEVREVLREFEVVLDHERQPEAVYGDYQKAKSLIDKAFDNPSEEFLKNVNLKQNLTIESLEVVDPKSLASFLVSEHPQTIALVMSYLSPIKFSETLQLLPQHMHIDILRRIVNLEFSSNDVLDNLNSILQSELKIIESSDSHFGGPDKVAQAINTMPKNMQENILRDMKSQNPQVAAQVIELMFTFDDLVKIDNRGIQELLKVTDSQMWLLALRDTTSRLKDHIFKNLSERKREIMQEDMEDMGPVKLEEIKNAQTQIIKTARQLEAEGKITVVHNPYERRI